MAKGKAPQGARDIRVELWPVRDLAEHPENPRRVRADTPGFADLLASVQANGVLEPLTVRMAPDQLLPNQRQILSGHRRFLAAKQAGLKAVPVIDKGALPDDVAFDLVAMGNLHEPLTPLEEGRRVATWLDKYGQDVRAVASKLGKPPHWVVQHAEIARGLSAEWQKAAESEMFDRWTAAHWVHIAKLPAALQATQLTRFCNHAHGYPRNMSAARVEECVKIDLLYLAKAPFDAEVYCSGCVDRTDRQPLLWAEAAEEATGAKARCLKKKCWERKCAAHAKAAFKAVLAEKGVPDAVPISLLEEPDDDWKRDEYRKKISAAKQQYGSKLLTDGQFELVEEGAKGAVPAIVVAGGKGQQHLSVKYIKLVEKKKSGGRSSPAPYKPSTAELKRQEERERWDAVGRRFVQKLADLPTPRPEAVLWVLAWTDWPLGWQVAGECKDAVLADPANCAGPVTAMFWQALLQEFYPYGGDIEETLRAIGPVLGLDVQAIYDAVVAEEAPPAGTPGVCRVCGCTEEDCSGCRARTGEACHWVDETRTLCSACAGDAAPVAPSKRKRASGSARRKKAKEKEGEKEEDRTDPVDSMDLDDPFLGEGGEFDGDDDTE